MKTNGKSGARDVVLTTAFGLPLRRTRLFFDSLARTGFGGQVVVFAANLSPRELSLYRGAGAEVRNHGLHLHRVLRRPLQAVFWRMVRRWPDAGSFSAPWDRLQQPNLLRWSLYRRYLEENRGRFDRVLMVDLRDVVFQSDPFGQVDPAQLHIYAEEGDVTVGQSAWNTRTMLRAFGPEGLQTMAHRRVSCSGAVAGGIAPVETYLRAFADLLPSVSLPDHGTDQAAHIRVVHGPLASAVDWQNNRGGDVLHLHYVEDPEGLRRDTGGRFLNTAGRPYAIVHQFDRHPTTAARLAALRQ